MKKMMFEFTVKFNNGFITKYKACGIDLIDAEKKFLRQIDCRILDHVFLEEYED